MAMSIAGRMQRQRFPERLITSFPSAATVNLGLTLADQITITGTTTITSFGARAAKGAVKYVRFTGALTLTYNATSLILPGTANITTAANDCAVLRHEGAGNWICISYATASGMAVTGASTPPSKQIFTSSGTWTKPAGCKLVKVTVLGGGGAGGGCTGGACCATQTGYSGGAGGTSIKWIDATSLTSESVTVGAAGAGSSNANGTSGGNSSFGSHCSANGGAGGNANATSGGSGGSAANGDINITGQAGHTYKFGGSNAELGNGGINGSDSLVVVPDGVAASGYGSGGSGSITNSSARSGGNGTQGIVIVEEFY